MKVNKRLEYKPSRIMILVGYKKLLAIFVKSVGFLTCNFYISISKKKFEFVSWKQFFFCEVSHFSVYHAIQMNHTNL